MNREWRRKKQMVRGLGEEEIGEVSEHSPGPKLLFSLGLRLLECVGFVSKILAEFGQLEAACRNDSSGRQTIPIFARADFRLDDL